MLRLMDADAAFDAHTFDCYEYPTRLFHWPLLAPPPGLRELAEGLKTFLRDRYSEYNRIDLVAHSLGGVVVRRFLVEEKRLGISLPIRKVALIAVPNSGSSLASVGKLVSIRHRQLKALAKNGEELALLDETWRSQKIEAEFAVGYFLGGVDRCVGRESACSDPQTDPSMLIKADHRNIITPTDRVDPRYSVLARFLLTDERAKVAHIRPADPLFDIYSPEQEEFYVERSFDTTLSKAVSSGHMWLCGRSGVGKSAALRRAAYRNGWTLFHVNLSPFQDSTPLGMLCALADELQLMSSADAEPLAKRNFETACLSIRNSLGRLCGESVCAVVVEEIPLATEQLPEFLGMCSSLFQMINGADRLNRRVVFAFSSIADLAENSSQVPGKVLESIQIMSEPDWSPNELTALVGVLSKALNKDLGEKEVVDLVEAAAGLPRYVKLVFRQMRNGVGDPTDFQAMLKRASGERS